MISLYNTNKIFLLYLTWGFLQSWWILSRHVHPWLDHARGYRPWHSTDTFNYVQPSHSHHIPMIFSVYYFHDIFPCYVHDMSMIFSMLFLCHISISVHEFSMIILCYFRDISHAIPMTFRWCVHDLPVDRHVFWWRFDTSLRRSASRRSFEAGTSGSPSAHRNMSAHPWWISSSVASLMEPWSGWWVGGL